MSLSIPTNILLVPTKSRCGCGHQLPCQQGPGEGVAWWGKGAGPGRVVGARGVVGEVEVEDQPAAVAAEVRALDRVEQVPAPAVGCRPRACVLDRDEEPAAVSSEPPYVRLAAAG